MRARFSAAATAAICLVVVPTAWAFSVTPGWECIPITAGQAVVSGGTGATPACNGGTTAVLAPTYVASGVGGKPTVEFSAENVQIINGTGSTAQVNGEGNLVLGYDENPGTQTGSHNLVLGESQDYSSVGDIVAGFNNQAAAAFSSVLGGYGNSVTSPFSSVLGGCSNLAGPGSVTLAGICSDTVHHNHDFATVSGGVHNTASGIGAAVGGGKGNRATKPCQAIPAAPGSC